MDVRKRILIIDDQAMNREILARRITRLGYEAFPKADGFDVVEFVQDNKIDLVLLDIVMPKIDGIGVLKALRDSYSANELPILMITAKSESKDMVTALEFGASDYLTKPVDFAVAEARIRTHLNQKEMNDKLKISEERYMLAMRGSQDGLWDWSLVDDKIYYSPRWEEMLGLSEGSLERTPKEWLSRVHPEDREQLEAALNDAIHLVTQQLTCRYRILNQQGQYLWMNCRAAVITDTKGKVTRIAGSQTDITQSMIYDNLTGLPNQLLFQDRLTREFERAKQNNTYVAVFVLNILGFKKINDSFGYTAGDELLRAVAERIQKALANTTQHFGSQCESTLAHFASDEFPILISGLKKEEDAFYLAKQLQTALGTLFLIQGEEIFIKTAIGFTLGPKDYKDSLGLLQDASVALSRSKQTQQCELFDSDMQSKIHTRLLIESQLQHAIEKNQLRVFYQPLVDFKSNQLVGVEALLRWEHPDKGLIGPDVFIPIAEETSLILKFDRWVMQEATKQVQLWRNSYQAFKNLHLHCNLSGKQFETNDLVTDIQQCLYRNKFPANCLHLEITESIIMGNQEVIGDILEKISGLGVKIDLDDFGTGYSSLSYLCRIPAHTIKVDRSFVRNLSSHGTSIIEATVALAHKLHLDVVIEGVETKEQFLKLKALGSDIAQGFFMSRPLPAEQFITWAQNWMDRDNGFERALASNV